MSQSSLFQWSLNVLRRPEALPTLASKARWLYWRHLRRYNSEVCHLCGRPVGRGIGSWWHSPDDLWIAIGGPEYGLLCPACFHDLARAKGQIVYFAATAWVDDEIHTIPVPNGWSAEQAWEAISRGDELTDPEPAWANIRVRDGRFVELCDA